MEKRSLVDLLALRRDLDFLTLEFLSLELLSPPFLALDLLSLSFRELDLRALSFLSLDFVLELLPSDLGGRSVKCVL